LRRTIPLLKTVTSCFYSHIVGPITRVLKSLHATRAAVEEGVVPGWGVALVRALKAVSALTGANEDQTTGIKILARAIEEPLRQIVTNAGEDAEGGVARARRAAGHGDVSDRGGRALARLPRFTLLPDRTRVTAAKRDRNDRQRLDEGRDAALRHGIAHSVSTLEVMRLSPIFGANAARLRRRNCYRKGGKYVALNQGHVGLPFKLSLDPAIRGRIRR
jgi:hypothetical protein